MNIKGTAFTTAKVTITQAFGEERWNAFMAKMAEKDSYYKGMILSIALIPVEKHLFFLNELIKEFFNNDKKLFFMFGKVAAKFTLSPGGSRQSFLLSKTLKQFVVVGMPQIWTSLYDESVLNANLENNIVHIKITQIPINSVDFEFMTVGYLKQALKIFGKKSNEKCIRGFSKGHNDLYYQFEIIDS